MDFQWIQGICCGGTWSLLLLLISISLLHISSPVNTRTVTLEYRDGNVLPLGDPRLMYLECLRKYGGFGGEFGSFVTVRLYEAHQPVICVTDKDVLRTVLVKDCYSNFTNRRDIAVNGELYDALVVAQNDDWRRIRSILTPSFTSGKLKEMFGIMRTHSSTLLRNLKRRTGQGAELEVKEVFGPYTMDVVAGAAFSVDIDSLNNPNDPFVTHAKKLNLNILSPAMVIAALFPFTVPLLDKLHITLFPPSLTNFFFAVLQKIKADRLNKDHKINRTFISEREENIQLHSCFRPENLHRCSCPSFFHCEKTPPHYGGVVTKPLYREPGVRAPSEQAKNDRGKENPPQFKRKRPREEPRLRRGTRPPRVNTRYKTREGKERIVFSRVDFLQLMIDSQRTDPGEDGKQTNKGLSDHEILSQAMVFIFGGYETSGNTLSFFFYSLATNPEVMRKLQEEVDRTFPNEAPVQYDALMNMDYLDATLNESMRLYTANIRLERVCKKTVEIGSLTIPKGTIVTIPIFALHRDPEYWPDPETFDPERFTKENKGSIDPYVFMPFGAGPRGCLGMRFALVTMKLAIVETLQRFNISACDETQVPLELSSSVLLIPAKPVKLRFTPRAASDCSNTHDDR
ncbi:hypothetical protein NFI96_027844 [Prochilodus magdalenae]|nr:hypothetical protein NFI96_027844 [Prochilodus magdalenae]